MKNNFILHIPVYNAEIIFSFDETDEGFAKSVRKYKLKLTKKDLESCVWNLDSVGTYTMLSTGQSIIRLKNYPASTADMGTLQHEIFHAVVKILDYIGFVFTPETDEPAAHLISYITDEVYKRIDISFRIY